METKMDAKAAETESVKKSSVCDVEALKKCLEENKGDHIKCQSQIQAFKSACSLNRLPSSSSSSSSSVPTNK